ncbi:hypothetical protein MSAN_02335900 [Mycena sanguinolenta]|uniref:Uncharacterized protein n=1 Tax=Mycena sanguinolenta TaxID=230812 RepID=A0A8H6X773_9AGAR|nr:hypothetical protein MSAN_02335900 [Mycena sanguinolenta]
MLFLLAVSVPFTALLFARGSLSLPSADDWAQLPKSLGGRLLQATPLAAPCFSVVNGQNSIYPDPRISKPPSPFLPRQASIYQLKRQDNYKGRSSSKGSLNLWTRNLTRLACTPNFTPEGGDKSYERTITLGGNGGGHSVLSPVYGLGVDRVLQFKIVTPDGEYRTANEFQNQDLFRALRSGEPRFKLQVGSFNFAKTSTKYQPFLKLIVDESYTCGTEAGAAIWDRQT